VDGPAGRHCRRHAVFSLLFAFLTLTLATNQVATGLSLTILGLGLSGMIGEAFIGRPGLKLAVLGNPGLLSDIPFWSARCAVFGQDPVFYISIALTVAVWWFVFRTRAGLTLRAVGDSHGSAHALGIRVIRIRYLAVLFGGACAGTGRGASVARLHAAMGGEHDAGRGWIALALVVFASWLPLRVVAGAYLFGAVTIAQFHAQAQGIAIPSQFLSALPYLATIMRSGLDFLQQADDHAEYAGFARQTVRSGAVEPSDGITHGARTVFDHSNA
jgi:ABC-type uncharacterized transport system permease subunit